MKAVLIGSAIVNKSSGFPCIYRYTQVYLNSIYQLRSYQACILSFNFLMILNNFQSKHWNQ